ncbi:hypothetical protein [Paenibacillus sp. RC67]|nr:hypothetical protein [Paenibacillus sp. RC67]
MNDKLKQRYVEEKHQEPVSDATNQKNHYHRVDDEMALNSLN